MALGIITLNYEYFPEFNKGRPIFNGKIFIGVPDQDPEILANQLPVTARQEDQTDVPIAQPIRTSAGGIPELNGSPVQLLVDGNYAIKILDSNDVQVYFTENVFNGVPIVVGDAHNLLGGREAVNAHDKIYPRQHNTFADLLSSAFAGNLSNTDKVETIQHTSNGIGGATYSKDGQTGTPSTGDEIQFFDSDGDSWSIIPVDGAVFAEQFGADPIGTVDSTAASNAVIAGASASGIYSIASFGSGTFKISASLQIPGGDGIRIKGSGHKTVLDASNAVSEFDLFGAPSTVALGLVIEGFTLLGSPVGSSYILNTTQCRNASTFKDLSIGKSGGTFGVNGIFTQASFYVNFQNIQIRELSGIGLHGMAEPGLGVNAVLYSGIYINGCNENIVMEADPADVSAALTLISMTIENSVNTAIRFENFITVDMINCYMEGNNPTALAGETTMIECIGGHVNIFGGLYKETPTGSPDALPFSTDDTSFISISDGVSLTQSNKIFFHPDLRYTIGIVRRVDMSQPYYSRYNLDHTLGEGRSFVSSKHLAIYAEMSTVPASGRSNSIVIETDVLEIDFNTAQTNEIYIFDILVGDVGNTFQRGGYRKFACTVMKRASVFNNIQEEQFDINFLTSTHATVLFVFAAGVLTMSIRPNNATENTVYRFVVNPILTGRNDRLKIEAP